MDDPNKALGIEWKKGWLKEFPQCRTVFTKPPSAIARFWTWLKTKARITQK